MLVEFRHHRIPAVAVMLAVLALTAGAFYLSHRSVPGDAAVQTGYRWRSDDGSESGASFAAAEGTPITVTRPSATPPAPVTAGTLAINDAGGTGPQQVFVYGDYAYIPSGIGGNDELAIVNVSDPANPVMESETVIVGMNFVEGIAADGAYAYLSDGSNGRVHVIDVSDPTAPFEAGVVTNAALTDAHDLAKLGHYVYVVSSGSSDKLTIVDVGNPANPVVSGSVSLGEDSWRVAVQGRYAYVTSTDLSTDGKLTVVDVSNPLNPTIAGSSSDPALFGATPIAVSGGYAFVGAYASGFAAAHMTVVDLSDPANPTVIGQSADNASTAYQDLDMTGHFVYLASAIETLDIMDVSDPTAPAFVSSTTLADSVGGFYYYIDVEGDYAYLSDLSGTSQLQIARLGLGDIDRLRFGVANSGSETEFAEQSTITLAAGENLPRGAVIDSDAGYMYVATDTSPSKIVKIDLATFTEVATLTLASGENQVRTAAVIDPVNHFAYFGTSVVNKVIKIDLTSFTEVGAITTSIGGLLSAVIDIPNQLAYFGADNSGGILKIDLSSFTEAGSLFPTPADHLRVAVIDQANGLAYFGNASSPAKVVKIDVNPAHVFAQVGSALTLAAGENILDSATIDAPNGFAYFGTETTPVNVVKVDLSSFTRVGSLSDAAWASSGRVGMVDLGNRFAYFSMQSGVIAKIDLPSFTKVANITLAGGNAAFAAVLDPNRGYVYAPERTTPSIVAKVSIAPRAAFRLEYGEKDASCDAIASWTEVPVVGTDEAWEIVPSKELIDGEATTNVAGGIADDNASFRVGAAQDVSAQTASLSLGERQFTEVEYSLRPTNDALRGKRYCFRLTDAGNPAAFTFDAFAEANVRSASGGGGGGGGTVAPSVRVTSPNGGESVAPGPFSLTWSSAGRVDLVNLAYSADDGASWTAIANAIPNAGTYSWTVPDVATTQARVRVEATDTATVFASDISDTSFTITGTAAAPPGTMPPPAGGGPTQPVPPGTLVPSPFNGLPEAVDAVSPGDYVRSPHYRGIFFVTDAFARRPFPYASLFFTYEQDLFHVKEVSDATLSTLPAGKSMPPKAGTVLLRFDGEAGIYGAFENRAGGIDPFLRRLDSEAIAVTEYGKDWKTFVLDLDNFLFTDYDVAAPIVFPTPVDASGLIPREVLRARVAKYLAALVRSGYLPNGSLPAPDEKTAP